MTINLSIPLQESPSLSPRITIIGVGGAGGNAVNNMIESRLEGVEFVVANTDAQAITQSLAERRIQLGTNITHGLGAGARPDIGRAAAEEAIDELVAQMQGVHMVFITAGMGGGTGTGAGPVIARLAREHGILTVGVVTKPFQFEGINRMRIAEAGIEEMQQFVDTLGDIDNGEGCALGCADNGLQFARGGRQPVILGVLGDKSRDFLLGPLDLIQQRAGARALDIQIADSKILEPALEGPNLLQNLLVADPDVPPPLLNFRGERFTGNGLQSCC